MKGWVGLVGWPIADGLPTLVVIHQLQVERRTGKVRWPETEVLPLCHATKWQTRRQTIKTKQNFCYSHAIMRQQCMVIYINTELNKDINKFVLQCLVSPNCTLKKFCMLILTRSKPGLQLASWKSITILKQLWNNLLREYADNISLSEIIRKPANKNPRTVLVLSVPGAACSCQTKRQLFLVHLLLILHVPVCTIITNN